MPLIYNNANRDITEVTLRMCEASHIRQNRGERERTYNVATNLDCRGNGVSMSSVRLLDLEPLGGDETSGPR